MLRERFAVKTLVGSMGDTWIPRAVAICVPVHNEAALLPALLDALAVQSLSVQSLAVPVTLCMVFDTCSDASERIVAGRAAALPFTVVTACINRSGAPDAGRARRAALTLGENAIGDTACGALLTTDADSIPAPDWVAATTQALGVADVVAGRIVRDRARHDAVQDRIEAYYDRLFALRRLLDPVAWEAQATHHHTGGASLAFRADAYATLGGFEPRAAGEDAAIVDAAHRAGLRVRRDRAVVVETSSRRIGRAIGGLADHLRTLAVSEVVRVAHPDDAAWQYERQAAARHGFARLCDAGIVERLALSIGLQVDQVHDVARASPNAEAFAMRIVPGSRTGERLIALTEAEAVLDALTGMDCERAA